LTGSNSYAGGTKLQAVVIRVDTDQNLGNSSGVVTFNNGTNAARLEFLQSATSSRGMMLNGAAALGITASTTTTWNGVISGTGSLGKRFGGTLILAGENPYSGATTITTGAIKTVAGNALGSTSSITVSSAGLLQISALNSVSDAAGITLSGGAILRDGGVSETFGNLNLTANSTKDFGAGALGTLTFGTCTPSFKLTVSNFAPGNSLVFVGSDLSSTINNSNYFSFGSAFTSSWDSDTSTFTIITPVPEASTVLAGLLMLGFLLWPWRKIKVGA